MPAVAEVVRRYGGAYLERFTATMPGEHKKVLCAIAACHTDELGSVLYCCQSCGRTHAMGRSCGNQHYPTCQQDKTKEWLETQSTRLLPCPYFLVTFTLPAELRSLAQSHHRAVYSALFEASSQALRTLAAVGIAYINIPGDLLSPLHSCQRTTSERSSGGLLTAT
jgi:hypothetical protein